MRLKSISIYYYDKKTGHWVFYESKFTVGGITECFFFLNHSLKVKQKANFWLY